MNTRLDQRLSPHESMISALSLTMLALIAMAIVMLARSPELQFVPLRTNQLPTGPAHDITEVDLSGDPSPGQGEIETRFQQAVMMLHAKRYDDAITALHRVIELSPRMPEAYVNLGYALIGLQRYKAARDFFQSAINLRPYQANAYWGLAVALENINDLEGALGAMRTYIHLAPAGDPYVRRARSALWEWETTLGRGPLPKEEQQWISKRGQEWEARNNPQRDAPVQDKRVITVRPIE